MSLSAKQEKFRAFRLQCYRRMLFADSPEEVTAQDMRTQWTQAHEGVQKVFQHLDTHTLPPAMEAEALLTAFVGLSACPRDWQRFDQCAERTYRLLPQLPDSKTKCHLLVHLYTETADEDLLPDIDRLMDNWHGTTMTDEDRYLQAFYEPQFQ